MRRVSDSYGEELVRNLPSAREEEEEHEKRGVDESEEERVQIEDERMWGEGGVHRLERIFTVL